MRKLLSALAFFGLAASSQAAFISCSEQTTINGGASLGPVTYTCSPGDNNIAGDFLNIANVQLRITNAFSDGNSTTGTIFSVQDTSSNSLGLGIGSVGCTSTGTSDVNG